MVVAFPFLSASANEAAAEDRSLKLYFVHTGEKAVITFKRNGRFDPRGLAQINEFLRDWRKGQPTRMDPRLFDLVWEVYRRSGATDYIHVVSAFRSPETNNMLRTRSRYTGVAKNSQHMQGKAMDFFIPGVKLSTLRALAMQMQVGGVGFYPTSGSPFVHLDVGGVRAWPRMTRQELVQIFPNGKTLHLPADGNPLPGYEEAMADYKKRVSSDSIQIASSAGGRFRSNTPDKKRPGLFAMLFGGGADEEEDNAESTGPDVAAQPAAPAKPIVPSKPAPEPIVPEIAAPIAVASAEPAPTIVAPVPLSRPAFRSDAGPGGLATALYSQARNPAQDALALQASAPATPSQPVGDTFADLSAYAVPVPTLLGARGMKGDAELMTASAGPLESEDLGAIPLPMRRPATTTLASSRTPDPQQTLTPELVAALSQSMEPQAPALAPAPAPVAAMPVVQPLTQAAVVPVSRPLPVTKPLETAAIERKLIQPSSKTMQFGDGFDSPKPVSASMGSVSGKATRGGRAAPAAASSNKGLTGEALAKWALNNNRVDAVASIKAPRVVSRTLNGEYSAAYAGGGFKPVAATVAIDPNRFSGPAN
ncbi:DUF882 domain-containing protein [Neorhizobium lilium]|uniref:Murein endopeptidase K n=1 Tax=Neorhizobium lilium TaxID=2503024 RepID=A0A3S3S8G3_9HYPH|nr:DUF882 domain-containing protein [Neorhizobium lilium]RWX79426.1 DUF882 domain-containing protein [Neorhizobium lilium]